MKRKKVTAREKAIPSRKSNKELNFEETVKKFNPYLMNPKEFNKIFTELGFSYAEEDCGGNCIKCKKKDNCKTYTEIKNIFKNGGSD
jgi:hypothetical protein